MHEPCAVSLYVIVADDAIDDTLEMEINQSSRYFIGPKSFILFCSIFTHFQYELKHDLAQYHKYRAKINLILTYAQC